MGAYPSAVVAARARALWPHLTAAGISDDTLAAWQDWAEAIAGPRFGGARLDAVAHLVAHAGTRAGAIGSSEGASPAGEVTGLSTLSLSASFGASGGGGRVGSDADLGATRPGQAYLALRASIPAINLPFVVAL